ncbi:NEDD4-binding protein 2-like 2 isoform X2 [Micropterus dolomieu]|uniref:NEDD4-binding protein 2-like 2 isoform X2 n=1 Tax=Micropterus dolomieu TaxID=147949 RepID=UPI001E8CC0CD|nr:NEDD4-binding protein 2-like 2 isoform X2 [Micropterus dolomieu]
MCTMSQTESFCTTTQGIGNRGVGVRERTEDGRADKDTTFVRSDSASPERNVRERVLKEVGLTSTTFIGPAFPPKTTTVKSDIEDTLSEFYKELENIDRPDGANDNPGNQDACFVQPPIPPKFYASKETQGVSEEKSINTRKAAETDCYQNSSGQKHPPWPHWYQNEPYYPRMPRPGMDRICGRAAPTQSQWRHPQTLKGPPNPRFHRPPFHRPPTPSAFPNPQNRPSHMNQNWSGSGLTNRYQEESHFPRFSSFPPPNVCSPTSQDFYGDSPYHFDRDERGCSYDGNSDHVNAGWSTNRKEELCQLGEDYDRWQRYDSENELCEHHCEPVNNNAYHSPLVLILMRGLPGSGKSTRARELLSIGPSGLILSTDDYFVHRDGYHYELGLLGAAHEWNQSRAKDAMRDGRSPIIIDNTNTQAWEMKPYVQMALERGYKVDFCEPDTSWKFDPYELEKKNKHGVPQEKIAQMMDRFSFPISVDIVMNSQEPSHVNQRRRPEQPQMIMKTRAFH